MNLIIAVFLSLSLLSIGNAFEIKSRIVNGYSAKQTQFPFYAFLEITYLNPFQGGACGGSLIGDGSWVLTAAHCVARAKEVTVHFGKSVLNRPERGHDYIRVGRNSFWIYPDYNPNYILNDIALIHLPRKVQFTSYVRPIQLPSTCESPDGVEVFAVGHGAVYNNAGVSPQLHYAVLKTLQSNTCRRALSIPSRIRSILCAYNGATGESVCSGDSGGPLVSIKDSTLIGIAAFVIDGCENGMPQGFTNVYTYLGWIRRVTKMNLPNC